MPTWISSISGRRYDESRHSIFGQAFRQISKLDGDYLRIKLEGETRLYEAVFGGLNAEDAGGTNTLPMRNAHQLCESGDSIVFVEYLQ